MILSKQIATFSDCYKEQKKLYEIARFRDMNANKIIKWYRKCIDRQGKTEWGRLKRKSKM
jgi:hypothetical protein